MKVYKPKSMLLSLLLIATAGFTLIAQEAKQEYAEAFNVSRGVTLSSDTKYSDIELLAWDKDIIDILVVVEVDASSKSKAEDALKKVKVHMSKSGNTVLLDTELEQGWSKNVKTKIDITINAPAYINLNLDNSYGDLFIQEVSGHTLLDLAYCNLKAGTLSRGDEKPYNKLKLAYSNGVIDRAGWMELEVAYSDMEINASEMLSMESKYSKLTGESAGRIVTEGSYDKYLLDNVDTFEAELKYSGVKFGALNKKLDLHSGYTSAKILKLARGFEEVDAELSYGGIYIDVEEGASFKTELESKYGNIKIAQDGKLSTSKENNYKKVWGSVGSSPRSNMHLITKYGNIEIE
jgi:hypothetical protein